VKVFSKIKKSSKIIKKNRKEFFICTPDSYRSTTDRIHLYAASVHYNLGIGFPAFVAGVVEMVAAAVVVVVAVVVVEGVAAATVAAVLVRIAVVLVVIAVVVAAVVQVVV